MKLNYYKNKARKSRNTVPIIEMQPVLRLCARMRRGCKERERQCGFHERESKRERERQCGFHERESKRETVWL